MTTGVGAALEAAGRAQHAGAGAATTLARAADAWADTTGGTSGALWGVLLRAWSGALVDRGPVTPEQMTDRAGRALAEVARLGGAQPGDKTMVDAFDPFAAALRRELADGAGLATAWRRATSSGVPSGGT